MDWWSFRQGRGVSVTGESPGLSELVARCRDLLGYSNRVGYRNDELICIMEGLS